MVSDPETLHYKEETDETVHDHQATHSQVNSRKNVTADIGSLVPGELEQPSSTMPPYTLPPAPDTSYDTWPAPPASAFTMHAAPLQESDTDLQDFQVGTSESELGVWGRAEAALAAASAHGNIAVAIATGR